MKARIDIIRAYFKGLHPMATCSIRCEKARNNSRFADTGIGTSYNDTWNGYSIHMYYLLLILSIGILQYPYS